MLIALFKYRGFVMSSIKNDFINRFSRSKLGGLWAIINPLLQVTIFTLILSNVLAAKLPGIENKNAYALFLMAGTLAWGLFSEIIGRCLNLFIEQGAVMKKIYFPRITLPLILVGSTLLNNILLFLSILIIFALLGHFPSVYTLWVPVLMSIIVIMALGVGLILGILNVFMRDIAQIVPVLLQISFWFTPIVYPVAAIPDEFKSLLEYNPIYTIVAAYHNVLVYGISPDWLPLLKITAVSLIGLLISLQIFRRANAEMIDLL